MHFLRHRIEFLHHFLYALSLTQAGIERRRRHFAAAPGFGYDSQVSAPLLKRQIVARIFVKAFPFRGAIKPGIHFIRKCQNGTTAFSRRPVDRESKLHFIPLNCADAASSVVRNVFPRMQHFPFIGCISEGGGGMINTFVCAENRRLLDGGTVRSCRIAYAQLR